ncbi:MAG: S8 family serine peptidase, partial [Clostridiales bacterium]|nr:S8 family serine peptidase [Clostridiales bacterium]
MKKRMTSLLLAFSMSLAPAAATMAAPVPPPLLMSSPPPAVRDVRGAPAAWGDDSPFLYMADEHRIETFSPSRETADTAGGFQAADFFAPEPAEPGTSLEAGLRGAPARQRRTSAVPEERYIVKYKEGREADFREAAASFEAEPAAVAQKALPAELRAVPNISAEIPAAGFPEMERLGTLKLSEPILPSELAEQLAEMGAGAYIEYIQPDYKLSLDSLSLELTESADGTGAISAGAGTISAGAGRTSAGAETTPGKTGTASAGTGTPSTEAKTETAPAGTGTPSAAIGTSHIETGSEAAPAGKDTAPAETGTPSAESESETETSSADSEAETETPSAEAEAETPSAEEPEAEAETETETAPDGGAPGQPPSTGGPAAQAAPVLVAVLDTGVDVGHADLAGFLTEGFNVMAGDSGVYDGSRPMAYAHGTHVAGIIAGAAAGRGAAVEILPIQVFENGAAYTSDIVAGIAYAEEHGASIVNCSFGTAAENPALYEAIRDSGMLFVCAAGNSRKNMEVAPSYPAAYDLPNVISVASVNGDGGFSYFSNYGETAVDLAAPGRSIMSALPENRTGPMTGTSMSA